jgi:hypothetical protein
MTTKIWKNYDATGRELHVDVPLSQAIMNYRTEGLLGEFIFPVVPVTKQSNMIPYIPLGEFSRSEVALRAPGTEANKVKFSVATMGYFCKNYALKYPLTIEDRENADEIWQVRQNGAYLITDLLRIQKELRVFNTVNSSTNVSTVFLPKSAWSTGGNPLDALRTALNRVQDTTGFFPNNLVFGRTAWTTIQVNSFLRGLLYPHGGGLVAKSDLASILGVGNIEVATGYYNSNAEGFSASLATFFDDAVLGFYNAPGSQIGPLPRYSATMRWSIPGIPNMAVEVHPFDSKVKAEEIEVGVYDDEKVLDKSLGFILKGCNSSQSNGI